MPAVEMESTTPISEKDRAFILNGLSKINALPELLAQDEITLEEIERCLNVRQQRLIELFGRSLKGPQLEEKRVCESALQAFADGNLTLKDLDPLKKEFLELRGPAAKPTKPPKKRLFGLF